jgi:hypothetical protein
MGVSINGGTQKMMFMFFDILTKLMRTRGTTILENLHINIYIASVSRTQRCPNQLDAAGGKKHHLSLVKIWYSYKLQFFVAKTMPCQQFLKSP